MAATAILLLVLVHGQYGPQAYRSPLLASLYDSGPNATSWVMLSHCILSIATFRILFGMSLSYFMFHMIIQTPRLKLLHSICSARVFTPIARVSYSMYLLHMPLEHLYAYNIPTWLGIDANWPLYTRLIATWPFSILSLRRCLLLGGQGQGWGSFFTLLGSVASRVGPSTVQKVSCNEKLFHTYILIFTKHRTLTHLISVRPSPVNLLAL